MTNNDPGGFNLSKRTQIALLFFGLSILLIDASNYERILAQADDDLAPYCVYSFERFAHEGPRWDEGESLMLPSAPWEVDHVLSNYLDSNHYRILELSFIYQADDHDALWLLAEQDNENLWIEFVPETGAIQTFADTLIFDGQELHVSDVYVDKNNDVWGAIRRGRTSVYVPAQVNYAVYPILARLDYSSLQFVPAIGTPETLREQPIAVVFDGEESWARSFNFRSPSKNTWRKSANKMIRWPPCWRAHRKPSWSICSSSWQARAPMSAANASTT
jgi:hypothetical protein